MGREAPWVAWVPAWGPCSPWRRRVRSRGAGREVSRKDHTTPGPGGPLPLLQGRKEVCSLRGGAGVGVRGGGGVPGGVGVVFSGVLVCSWVGVGVSDGMGEGGWVRVCLRALRPWTSLLDPVTQLRTALAMGASRLHAAWFVVAAGGGGDPGQTALLHFLHDVIDRCRFNRALTDLLAWNQDQLVDVMRIFAEAVRGLCVYVCRFVPPPPRAVRTRHLQKWSDIPSHTRRWTRPVHGALKLLSVWGCGVVGLALQGDGVNGVARWIGGNWVPPLHLHLHLHSLCASPASCAWFPLARVPFTTTTHLALPTLPHPRPLSRRAHPPVHDARF
jgi:hypothetical protein